MGLGKKVKTIKIEILIFLKKRHVPLTFFFRATSSLEHFVTFCIINVSLTATFIAACLIGHGYFFATEIKTVCPLNVFFAESI